MKKVVATSKCTSIAGHFDGHVDPLKQFKWHLPMQHVQGYTRSHWTLPLGNYLLCIAPAATRATSKQTTMKKNYFAGHFDGHGNVLVRYRVYCPLEEVQGFTRSHWPLLLGKYYVK
jgi:hypothetical protein